MKRLLWGTLAALLLALAGGAWWLYGNLDAIVARAIARYGSQMSGAKVSVEAVQLRSTDGIGVVRGLTIGNPPGFRSDHALKVGVIEVAIDVRTLTDPVVVVKRIAIDSPDIIYEKGDGLTNFDAIQQNIARSLASPGSPAQTTPSGAPPRKLIVEDFVIRNAHAQATAQALLGKTVSATLPDVHLRQLGRAEGGLTPAQLGQVIARAISQRLVASLGFERVLKSLGDRVIGLFGR
jgi:hypothetical protein